MLKANLILLSFLFCAKTFAQEPIRYTTKQGLPTNHVYDMQEDTNGFMWFATKQGLVKYDGETFKTFTMQNGLPNNDTWKLDLDYQGRLWYFSKSAYQGYIKNDSIYKFAAKDKKVITPTNFSKSKDNYWFYADGIKTIENNKIVDVGLDNDEFNKLQLKLLQKLGLINNQKFGHFINPERKELIFFNTKNQELLVYDWNFNLKHSIRTNTLHNLEPPKKFIEAGLIYNQISFHAFETGVMFIDFKTNKIRFILFKDLFGVEKPMYFRCKSVKNNFQISIPGHLAIFDYQLIVKKTFSFPKQLSQYSFKDSRDNIWLTSISSGISLIPNTQLQTATYFKNQKVQKINKIGEDLYVGINNKGIYTLNTKNDVIKNLYKFSVPHSEVYQIKKDKFANKTFIVTAIQTFTNDYGKLSPIKIKGTNDNYFSYGYGEKDIITYKGSIFSIHNSSILKTIPGEECSKIVVNKNGLTNAKIFNNELYIGGSDGLYQLENDTLLKPIHQNELLNVPISALTASNNYLIIGTDGRGVYLYNKRSFFHLKITDGLSLKRILKVNDTLWLASQKGVKKILLNKEDLTQSTIINAFYVSDGLLQNNTNDIYLQDSLLYVASDIGVAKINLNQKAYKQAPKIYFKTTQDTLYFKNGERNNIAINFAIQDYVNQEHVNYKYRLLPINKDWTSTESQILNFTNLSPKMYVLEIKATDQHNNERIEKQYLNVIPAWWQTLWAKIGFSILGILFILGLFTIIKNQIRKKEEAKAEQNKHIASLELQALRSQMNPHFVHNSLNAIQYFIQRNEVELSEKYLVKFSKLIRLFFEYSRRQSITIKEELELLTYYLDIEKLRFEEKLNYTITVCNNIDQDEQLIPSMILQPIVENAVNHGLFHKQGNGTVTIEIKQIDDKTFQVEVKDNGIGIIKAKEIYKSSSKNYQSNSSAVLHERLDLLNQSKDWNILYNIKDISTINDGKGTSVTLTFNQPKA